VLRMARLLVSKDTRHTFGQTELQLRDILHRAGAKALETSLVQKKLVHGRRNRVPMSRRASPSYQGCVCWCGYQALSTWPVKVHLKGLASTSLK
jgi:hypothetical protein